MRHAKGVDDNLLVAIDGPLFLFTYCIISNSSAK